MLAGPQSMSHPSMMPGHIHERRFQPYEVNGGSVASIGGQNFCVVAGDTRLSRGYGILSRNQSKAVQLTSKVVLISGGMHADRNQLHTILQLRLKEYELEHGKEMPPRAVAQMLSNTLYSRRFFPYYTFNLLCGIEENGQGVVFGYDAIGSYKEDGYGCQGSGMEMMSPMLDFVVNRQHDTQYTGKPVLTEDEAVNTIKSCINAVSERDIQTGDSIEMWIIRPEGVEKFYEPLRRD